MCRATYPQLPRPDKPHIGIQVPTSATDWEWYKPAPKKKAKKAKKDPNAPKGPRNAFVYYCMENRAKVKVAMPELTTSGEIMKQLGTQWKGLSAGERVGYEAMAVADKVRYLAEVGG